ASSDRSLSENPTPSKSPPINAPIKRLSMKKARLYSLVFSLPINRSFAPSKLVPIKCVCDILQSLKFAPVSVAYEKSAICILEYERFAPTALTPVNSQYTKLAPSKLAPLQKEACI